MNDIQIFNNPEFGEIRTVIIDDEPWFVGIEVAKALGYAVPKTATAKHVDIDDRLSTQIEYSGQMREIVVINESGLYSLIFGSKLESAKKFKRWVTSDVLPSIRKGGSYNLPQTTDGKIALLAQGHTELKAEVDNIKAEVESIKNDMPILPVEADLIVTAVRKRGVKVLGGKESKAYKNQAIRQKVYTDLYWEIKHQFGVRSYKAIRRADAEKAIEIAEQYKPPLYLEKEISKENRKGGAA